MGRKSLRDCKANRKKNQAKRATGRLGRTQRPNRPLPESRRARPRRNFPPPRPNTMHILQLPIQSRPRTPMHNTILLYHHPPLWRRMRMVYTRPQGRRRPLRLGRRRGGTHAGTAARRGAGGGHGAAYRPCFLLLHAPLYCWVLRLVCDVGGVGACPSPDSRILFPLRVWQCQTKTHWLFLRLGGLLRFWFIVSERRLPPLLRRSHWVERRLDQGVVLGP